MDIYSFDEIIALINSQQEDFIITVWVGKELNE